MLNVPSQSEQVMQFLPSPPSTFDDGVHPISQPQDHLHTLLWYMVTYMYSMAFCKTAERDVTPVIQEVEITGCKLPQHLSEWSHGLFDSLPLQEIKIVPGLVMVFGVGHGGLGFG